MLSRLRCDTLEYSRSLRATELKCVTSSEAEFQIAENIPMSRSNGMSYKKACVSLGFSTPMKGELEVLSAFFISSSGGLISQLCSVCFMFSSARQQLKFPKCNCAAARFAAEQRVAKVFESSEPPGLVGRTEVAMREMERVSRLSME